MELHEKDLLDFNGKLQDLDDKLENYTVTLKKKINQASGADLDDLINNVNTNTSKISTLEKSLSDYKTEANAKILDLTSKTNNLNSSMTTIKKNLSYAIDSIDDIYLTLDEKTEDINNLNTKVTTLETNVATNSSSIQSLKTDNETNKTNISSLQTDMDTAKQDILDLKNNQGGDTTELETKVNKIESITNKFISLIKDRNASTNPDYTEINADTVVQTYDYADRLYDFTGTGEFHSADFYFTVPSDCNAHIKITTHITSTTSGKVTLKLYYNGDTLTDTVTCDYDASTTFTEFDFDKSVLATGNILYFKLSSTSDIHFTYAKVEISGCTNPVMLIKAKKFDVLYALGKYYLSDCSTGTLKLATINVDDLATTDDIVWQDTGIDARECAFTVESGDSAAPYTVKAVHYAVIHKNNNITFYDTFRNIEKPITSAIACKISYLFSMSNYIYYYATVIHSNAHKKLSYYTSDGSVYYMNYDDNTISSAYYLNPKRNNNELYLNSNCNVYCIQFSNKDIQLKDHYSNHIINIGKGELLECYAYGPDSKLIFHLIVKEYNKVIKYIVGYNSSNTLEIQTKEFLGYYDLYFMGANDDYFIVKNNKLHYYKNSLQDLDSQTTET